MEVLQTSPLTTWVRRPAGHCSRDRTHSSITRGKVHQFSIRAPSHSHFSFLYDSQIDANRFGWRGTAMGSSGTENQRPSSYTHSYLPADLKPRTRVRVVQLQAGGWTFLGSIKNAPLTYSAPGPDPPLNAA